MKGFFTFDNLYGEYALLGRDVERGVPTAVYGLSDAQKYLIAALVPGRSVFLTADALSAKRACDAISALGGKRCALLAAKDEVITYRKAFSKDALYRRLNALYAWQTGADVLVLDVESALQLVPVRMDLVRLRVGSETVLSELSSKLVKMGYAREYTVEAKGAFAVRGDILEIKPYDEMTGERLPLLDGVDILAATDVFFAEGEQRTVEGILSDECKRAENAAAYARMKTIAGELVAEDCANDFVLPLLKNAKPLFSVLEQDALVIFDECKLIRDKLDGLIREHETRCGQLLSGGEAMVFSCAQYVAKDAFYADFAGRRTLALSSFLGETYFFRPLSIRNIPSAPVRRYLNSFPDLVSDLKIWQKTGYRVLLYAGLGNAVLPFCLPRNQCQ